MIPRTRLAALLALPALLSPALHAQDYTQGNAQGGPQAQDASNEQYQGENPDRYAMVRALDGQAQITKGEVQDTLTKGTPVGEGDVVDSSGRGVLQLADGTRIAFGAGTRFTVASLFKDQNGDRQVLLRLDRGRLRVKADDDSGAMVRIDTPSGSIASTTRSTFNVQVDSDGVTRISVRSGSVRVSNQRDDMRLAAGEQLSVFGSQDPLSRVRAFNTYDQDDFDRWVDGAWTVKRGESWDRVPAQLRYYSDDLDSNGSWVYSEDYGWVWKPNRVADDWRPYYSGRWAAYPGGMTWISYDPWAYVTYHHGRWAWAAGGWCWIPGVYYSPAWVAWSNWGGYCGWAPLGYYNTPAVWGYGAWGGGYCWNVVSINYINVYNVNRYCSYDRTIIRGFNRGTGASGWVAGRGIQPPWRTRPLMATHAEFRSPGNGAFNRAFQPAVERQRFTAYQERAASHGRTVYFRPGNTGIVPPNRGGVASPVRTPFEDRGALNRQHEGRPGNTGGNTGIVPPDRRGNGGVINRPGTTVPDRGFPDRGGRPENTGRPGNPGRPGNTGIVPPDRRIPDRGIPDRGIPDRGNTGRGNTGIVPPDRRPAPERTPDRSFDRDFDRPAPRPMPQAPRREAPPVREAPPRFENRQPAPQRENRPSAPARSEPTRSEPTRSEPSRGSSGGWRGRR
ncbi:MAG: FecR domain-containing protein [Acidobacteria bacterium]|nr:FecR domain-containing protein [Acidobacteriota bacterium]